jgi:hypothetical protein
MEVRFADGQVEQYEDKESFFGAQGILYRSRDGQSLVKLYPNDSAQPEHVRRIDKLINELNPTKDDPYWRTFFTWPEKRAISPSVGFKMRYVGGMRTIENYFLAKPFMRLPLEDRGWFVGRVATAIKLVAAANRLSTMGLCYPDFSGKNVLVDPFAGAAVLIDCDSLTVPGELSAVVDGSPEFRAPELVTQELALPNLTTDRHAMAVLLYRWFCLIHPLFGDRHYATDPEQDELLRYGKLATYIEHPTDMSNHASKQAIKAHMLGSEMARLFERAFVHGLRNPRSRPHAFEWLMALYHMYDQIVPCATPECWWHFFVARPGESFVCPACQKPLQQPEELPFVYLLQHRGGREPNEYLEGETKASHYLVGWPGRMLYQWHIRPDATPNYTSPASVPDLQPWACFALDQKAANWSIKNVSRQPMYYQLPEDIAAQRWRTWSPNEHIWLSSGMQLQFGPAPYYFRALVRMENTQKARST